RRGGGAKLRLGPGTRAGIRSGRASVFASDDPPGSPDSAGQRPWGGKAARRNPRPRGADRTLRRRLRHGSLHPALPHHAHSTPLPNDFVDFLRNQRALPVVVQLALMHYQFETIHPFNDGNGRVGRLLITLMLCERKVLPQPLLYLSAFFEQHRDEYYDHLLNV